jgi:hypothetical protein
MIAERIYWSGETPMLKLRLYLPYSDTPGVYKCRYELSGAVNKSMAIAGIDAIDAIDNALWMAGSELVGLNESQFDGKLRWEGADDDKPIGLPVIRADKVPFKGY